MTKIWRKKETKWFIALDLLSIVQLFLSIAVDDGISKKFLYRHLESNPLSQKITNHVSELAT